MEISETINKFCIPKIYLRVIVAFLLIAFSLVVSWIYINNYLQQTRAVDNGVYCTSPKVKGICLPKSVKSCANAAIVYKKKYVTPNMIINPQSCTTKNPICCVIRK